MLSVRTRQTYLKTLGFYKGNVDGKWGPKSKAAVTALQNKYFRRASDRDGKYGPNTEKLLLSAYNCRGLKYFRLEEFRCKCGHCTGYPAVVSRQLVLNLEKIRAKYGRTNIISALRCKWKNDRLAGSSKNSRHMSGKAADFQAGTTTNTATGRRAIVAYWYKLTGARYSYANTSNMGRSVHGDVK